MIVENRVIIGILRDHSASNKTEVESKEFFKLTAGLNA